MPHDLIVALGDRHYRVERPFGAWPQNSGFVTDVTVDGRGHVFVMLRHDPLVHPADPRVIELDPEGRYLAGWAATTSPISHMLTATASGHLIAVDRDMHEIIWFTPDGQRVGQLGQRGRPNAPFNHPTDVSIAPGRHLCLRRLWRGVGPPLRAGRAPSAELGRAGIRGWPVRLAACDLDLRDGCVVVIDRTWNRVQVFDGEGRHPSRPGTTSTSRWASGPRGGQCLHH